MIEDLAAKFATVSHECAQVPKKGIALSADFIEKYTAYIKSGARIPGGFYDVIFDSNGANLQGAALTPISNYGFAIAYKLSGFYTLLREYENRFKTLYSDKTNDEKKTISRKLRDNDVSAVNDLNARITSLPADEKDLVFKFLTNYEWWHGGKEVGRTNDFVNSPLLKCANLVAAANGAIPSLAAQFAENPDLLGSFAFSIGSDSLTIKVDDIDNKSKAELVSILLAMEADTQTKSSAYRILGLKYPVSISKVGTNACKQILADAGLPDSYDVEINKGIKLHALIADRKWGLSFHDESHANSTDRLSIALKLFTKKRVVEEWCSDNTDGDANKPRAGYVANKQLRVLLNTPSDIMKLNGDTPSNIRSWFKNYWNVSDGKSWIEGLTDTELGGFGPYVAHLLQPSSLAVSKPAKFSNALKAAVKTVIKPDAAGMCDEHVHNALSFLGLISFGYNVDFSDIDYDDVLHAQRVILRRLREMKVPQVQEFGKTYNPPPDPNWKDADYLTVNEFLWFVNKNQNPIEKQVLEGKMIAAKHKGINSSQKGNKPTCKMDDNDDVLLLRLRAALRTKPFAILAGHSGTGKSRMVRKLAYMTCNDQALREDENSEIAKDPGNFCMVQVKPNWHDSGDLLGYYSELGKRYRASDFVKFIVKAYAYPDTPFFVCLDEMNLAPVEQYFAEYLSAIESRKLKDIKVLSGDPLVETLVNTVVSDELIPRSAYIEGDGEDRVIHFDWLGCELKESEYWIKNYGLTIPRNLFVVGTVNMDETTNQFSRKVLDRAMTIEMNDADFDSFGKTGVEPSFNDYMGDDAVADLLAGEMQASSLTPDQKKLLNSLKEVLNTTSFAVAYRFANEYALYEKSLESTMEKTLIAPAATGTGAGANDGAQAAASGAEGVESATGATVASGSHATAEGSGTTAGVSSGTTHELPVTPTAFDDMVLMKVLPRISGDESYVRKIFFGEGGNFPAPKTGSLLKLVKEVGNDTASARKIDAIDKRGGSYLSFWP